MNYEWEGLEMHIEFLPEETTWKTRHRWKDNIRMCLKEIGWVSVY